MENSNETYEPFKDYPDVVGVDELKKMLGCGRNTIYKLIHNGTIPAKKIGRSYSIPKRNIIMFCIQLSTDKLSNDK